MSYFKGKFSRGEIFAEFREFFANFSKINHREIFCFHIFAKINPREKFQSETERENIKCKHGYFHILFTLTGRKNINKITRATLDVLNRIAQQKL